MLVKFLKNKKGQRVGCLVGTEHGIGWSTAHTRKDKFDRDKALDIAEGRSKRGYNISITGSNGIATSIGANPNTEQIATVAVRALPDFIERCNRYFANYTSAK